MMNKIPKGSSSVKTSNWDIISCFFCSCLSSFISSTLGNEEGSSNMLEPAVGVNQSALLGSS